MAGDAKATAWKKIARGVALTALAAGFSQPAIAQVTTSGLRGVVSNADGGAVAGATVTVTDTRTGVRRTTTSSGTGQFDVRNLEVGGPYSVTYEASGQQPSRLDGVQLNLGEVADLNLTFTGSGSSDVIVVTASRRNVAQTAAGPSAAFSLDTLENAPAANRDIKDIVRMDPRIYMDEAFVDSISCAGANPRFNSLTVDGVRLNDNFGLNSNGYPTERIPFSYDAVRQVSVQLAPFDVKYGSFTACNINAVTKSGSNALHGSAFFDFASDDLKGDTTDGVKRNLGDYTEKRYGVTLGGPIIKDKLFFFGAYEKFQGANIFGAKPADIGLTDAAYQAVIDTAVQRYGYVPGGLPTSIPVEDEKFFARLDWNISDRHRAVATYNFNDGYSFNGSDTNNALPDGNHYYERGAKLKDYTAALYSDWTGNLSTEARVSYLKLDNRQIPVWKENHSDIRVDVPGANGTVAIWLGPDDSRHSNVLYYDLWNYKFVATYRTGDHVLTGGYELEQYDVFNLFVAESKAEYRFTSPANFAAGIFSTFQYTNAAGTNKVNDGAAKFGYNTNSFYLQDEWKPTDRLDIVAGLRYDWYQSDDKPKANAAFQTRYGFSNDSNLDGKSLAQPRVGVNYDFSDSIKLHGGFGLFSGGNPNVWLSNNYGSNGSTLASATQTSLGVTNLSQLTFGGDGRPFYNVPTQAINAVATAVGSGFVNALDPNFKIPSEWKFAAGAVWDIESDIPWVGGGWRVYLDFLYSKTNEAATVIPLGYVQSDTAPDGRPIYRGASNTNDMLLTNTKDKGSQKVFSINVSKDYDNGIDWSLGYAYTDAEDVNPMTSSVAFSNFSNIATANPLNPGLATSDYEIAHRFTAQFNWEKEFFANAPTRVSLFGTANQGAPYSYVYAINSNLFEPSSYTSTRSLAYIPTGTSDPLIAATSNAAAVQALMDYVNGHDILSGYKGQIATRNIGEDDWWAKVDLKISQSVPGFLGEDSAEAFLVINNLTNLINDKWGILREHAFPGTAELYTATIASGRYNITAFNPRADQDTIVVDPSLWEVRVGLSYKF